MDKFYKIYSIYDMFGKKNDKLIFIGVYKDFDLAKKFKLNNYDLAKLRDNVKIEYGEITVNDIKDLKKMDLELAMKRELKE